jgi:hypothetical protein
MRKVRTGKVEGSAPRLPGSWIPPDHLLDLRVRGRLRHALVHEHGQWQQRMQAVLYHHGLPKRADLCSPCVYRGWVEQLPLPAHRRAGRRSAAHARLVPARAFNICRSTRRAGHLHRARHAYCSRQLWLVGVATQ